MDNGQGDDPGGGGGPPSPPPGAPPGGTATRGIGNAGGVPGGSQPAYGMPTGISPATQQTGQQGLEMEARIGVNFLANQLVQLSARLGPGSELGAALHKAAGVLAKAVPPGSIPPGAEMALLHKMMMASKQNQANVAAMRQMPGGAAAGGAQPGMPPPPTPRPPSMPQMFGAGGGTSPGA